MRIAVLIDRYLPILGGAQKNVHDVCRRLVKAGFRVTVLTRRVVPELPERDRIDGVAVRRFGYAPQRVASKALCSAQITAHLLRRRRDYDAALCVACMHVTDVLPGYLAWRFARLPYVIRTTGIDNLDVLLSWRAGRPGQLAWRLLIPPPLWRRAFARAGLVVIQSGVIRDHVERYALPRSTVIRNGVDTNRFREASAEERASLRRWLGLPAERVIVVTTGRYVEGKNQIALLRAVDALARTPLRKRLLLLVVGATERRQVSSNERQLKSFSAERELSDVVRFVDDAPNVEDYLRASDVFAFPSRYPEGISNSLLEAMACGLPLVCSDLPQNSGVLPEEGSYLFDPDDEAALARQLRRLVESPALREAHRDALASHARQRFPSEGAVRRWQEVFAALERGAA